MGLLLPLPSLSDTNNKNMNMGHVKHIKVVQLGGDSEGEVLLQIHLLRSVLKSMGPALQQVHSREDLEFLSKFLL